MMLTLLAVIGLAFSLDLLIGEPPNALHPVAWFGRVVALTDREWSADEHTQRRVGVAIALVLPLGACLLGGVLVHTALEIHPMVGTVAAAVVLSLTISLRMLLDLTRAVVDATADDLERARQEIRGLVGRDTDELSAGELRSAAVESAGENLADGLVATLVPFALLAPYSLSLAAAAAVWVKAVNTLDSMLGYRSKPIGTASARLDDVVMWIPARISAHLIALAALDPGALMRARAWSRAPTSPNSGWPMATLACALGVRLEKRGVYVLNSEGDLPTLEDGTRAVSLVGRAGVLALVLAVGLVVYAAEIAAVVGPIVDLVFESIVEPVLDTIARLRSWIVSLGRQLLEIGLEVRAL